MKKIFVFVLLITFSSASLYSQENFDYSKFDGVSTGVAFLLTGDITGGILDFSFNLHQNNESGFFVRNHIEINGGGFGANDFQIGVFGFRERVSIGDIIAITDSFAVKLYGIVDFGFSFFDGGVKNELFNAPYMLEVGSGGGMEFLFTTNSKVLTSAFFEAGGRYRFFVGDANNIDNNSIGISASTAFINIGFRAYF